MANSYKDIVITPNRGSSTDDPKIVFSGANTSVNTDITLRAYPEANGTLSFEGSAGQLFSITNDLTGSIFSVNDVSGIPLIDVNVTSQLVTLVPFYGNVSIGSGIITTSGSSFISQKTAKDVPIQEYNTQAQYNTYKAFIRSTNANNTFTLGRLADATMGFYGYFNSTTANQTDFYAVLDNAGIWIVSHEVRAPIFKDSNNTAYYIDPLSTSVLNTISMQGNIQPSTVNNTGGGLWYFGTSAWGGNISGANSVTGMLYSGGAGSQLFTFASGPGQMSVQADGSLFAGDSPLTYNPHSINASSIGFVAAQQGISAAGIIYSNASVRAPIFYDSDDANVRWDNNVFVLRGASPSIFLRDTDGTTAALHCNSNFFYILRGTGDTETMTQVNSQWPLYINLTNNDAVFGGNLTAAGNMYSPYYYDSNDTGYYLNPQSMSVLHSVAAGLSFRRQNDTTEGGEFSLEKANNSTLSGNVTIDTIGSIIRIFEGGGTARGGYLDLASCATGASSILLHTANYNSYAPTLTGTGASGTWGISVTGSANNATYLNGLSASSYIQRYPIPNTAGATGWVNLGTFACTQDGDVLKIKINALNGYNALNSQNQITELYFKTSNGISNVGGFYGDAYAFTFGPNTNAPTTIRIVQSSTTSYVVHANFGTNSGTSFYEISHNGTSWTHSGTNNGATAPTGTYIDVTEYKIWTELSDGSGSGLDADLLDGLNASSAAGASTIVARDANGYIFSNYINTTDDVNAGTISNIVAKFGDNYHRSASAAKVASFISGQTMNIVGSASSVTNALTINNGGAGSASGTTYNGSAAVTISHNSIGAVPTGRTIGIVQGTGVTVTSSGSLDLTANRSWTIAIGQDVATTAAPTFAGLTATGLIIGRTASVANVSVSNDSGSYSARGSTTAPAVMTFHRAGAYAINMGLDTDNIFKIGGWSDGVNTYRLQLATPGNLSTLNGSLYIVNNLGIGTSSPFSSSGYGWVTTNGSTGGIYSIAVNNTEYFRIQTTTSSTTVNSTRDAPLLLSANNAEVMRVTTNGRVGVNAGAPGAKIAVVNGTAGLTSAAIQGIAGNLTLDFNAGGGHFYDAGGHYFRNFAGTALMTVGTALTGTGNRLVYSDSGGQLVNTASDLTLKTNIEPITYGLAAILQLNPISYKWKDHVRFGAQREIGFGAQEVQQVIPEVIGINSDDTLSVDYPKLTAALTKAVQELSAKLDSLKNEFDQYKSSHP